MNKKIINTIKLLLALFIVTTSFTSLTLSSKAAEGKPHTEYTIPGTGAILHRGSGYTYWNDGIGRIKVNDEDFICIDSQTFGFEGEYYPSYDFDELTIQQKINLSNIGYYGLEATSKTDDDYSTTQFMSWEELGDTVEFKGSFGNNYPTFKDNVNAKIARHNIPVSFKNNTYTVNVGETLTITDTNGILEDFHVSNDGGANVTINGSELNITPSVNTPDDTTITLAKIRSENLGTSFGYRTGPQGQDVAIFKMSDPFENDITIHVNKFGSLEIAKVDDKGTAVPNTEFTLSWNDDMSDPIGTYTTGVDGKVKIDQLLPNDIYIQETKVNKPLLIDNTIYKRTIVPNDTITFTQVNEKPLAKIVLTKQDSETGSVSQGDANLRSGAEYTATWNKDVIDELSGQKLYSQGDLIGTKVVGDDLTISWDNLYVAGDDAVKINETKAPLGYKLDPTDHIVSLNYVDSNTKEINVNITSSEDVMKRGIEGFKVSTDGSTGEINPVAGAEFTYKLKSEIEEKGWENARTYAKETTDNLGKWKVEPLPFGRYIQSETVTPHNMIKVPDKEVVIDEDNATPITYYFNDAPYKAYLRVGKLDLATNQMILKRNVPFQIFHADGTQYKEKNGLFYKDTFTTDKDGYLETNRPLDADDYYLVEQGTLDNFNKPNDKYKFSIDQNGEVIGVNEVDNLPIVLVKVYNERPTAKLVLAKTFEKYDAITDKVATFEVRVKDKEISPVDKTTVLYEKGELIKNPNSVDGLWTVKDGEKITIDQLQFGLDDNLVLEVTEKSTNEAYDKDTKTHEIVLTKENDTQEVYSKSLEINNKLKRTDLEITKTHEYTGKTITGLKDFEFTLYEDEELTKVLTTGTISELTGKLTFKDIVFGTTGYLKETKTNEDYFLSDEVIKIVFDNKLEGLGETHKIDFANKPIPKIGTLATGINGEKELDPTVDNEVVDVINYEGIDTDKTYEVKTLGVNTAVIEAIAKDAGKEYSELNKKEIKQSLARVLLANPSLVLINQTEKDVKFDSIAGEYTVQATLKANTLKDGEGIVFFEYFTDTDLIKPTEPGKPTEPVVPTVEHEDPTEPGQTIKMKNKEYEIQVNKVDSSTNNPIVNSKFVFTFKAYKDGELVKEVDINGDENTGIATFKFTGEGSFDKIKVIEKDAPDGYVLSKEVKEVTMKDFDESNIYSFVYNNDRMPRRVVTGVDTQDTIILGLSLVGAGVMIVLFIKSKKKRK